MDLTADFLGFPVGSQPVSTNRKRPVARFDVIDGTMIADPSIGHLQRVRNI